MAPVEPSDDIENPERSVLDVGKSFVAVDSGRVVGVCSYILHSPELAETASLAVDPSCRGKGIGYRLQVARLNEMKRIGIRKVHTETDREETIKWYINKFGYRRTGSNPKKHDFSLTDVDTWTVLQLELDDYEIRE
jgi:3-keto-5-aminohexanoate cleavage enzyme